jgi:L-iditol 2-dehydrogenase
MKALYKYAPGVGNIEIRDMAEPRPGPGEVKCEVKFCGVCGTDIHIYHGRFKEPPLIMGHEWSGVVVETGPGVESVKVGERVTSVPVGQSCGRCRYCLIGQPFLCDARESFNRPANGGFAQYVIAREKSIRRLPDNIGFEAGTLLEPLACVVKSVMLMGGISAGETVFLTGPGPIGLLALQVAKAEGGFVILAGTDSDAGRLQVGRQLGADVTVNVQAQDAVRLVQELTDGYGADIVLECSGARPAVGLGAQAVRKRGRFAQVGVLDGAMELDFMTIFLKDLRLSVSYASSFESWDRAILLAAQGKVRLEPLISHILPLSEWKKGFDLVQNRLGLKVLLYPDG